MKKLTLGTSLLLAIASPSWAGLSFSVTSASGTPGTTTGWGFTATVSPGDPNFYFLNEARYCFGDPGPVCNPIPVATGTYTDFVAANGGYVFDENGIAFGANPYVSPFNANTQSGAGSFAISPLATPHTVNGFFQFVYDVYDLDPLNDPNAISIGQGTLELDADLEIVAAVSPVPEPGFYVLTTAGLAGLLWFRRRRQAS